MRAVHGNRPGTGDYVPAGSRRGDRIGFEVVAIEKRRRVCVQYGQRDELEGRRNGQRSGGGKDHSPEQIGAKALDHRASSRTAWVRRLVATPSIGSAAATTSSGRS